MTKKSRYLPWLHQLALSLGCLLLLIACNASTTTQNANFKVAVEPAFPPFEMQSASGNLEGFDLDLMNAVGTEAGLRVKFESFSFDGIIPALQTGKVDAAISAITITAQRAQTVSFSRPYFKAGLAIAVRKDNQKIKSFDDLKNRKIGVQIGTTGAKFAETVSNAKITNFKSSPLAFQALLNGNVDAVVNDAPATLYAIRTQNLNGLKIVGELLTEEYYGIVLPKNSPHLDKINQALTAIIDNGTYKKIYQKWFGSEPPQLPETAPAVERMGVAE